MVNVHRAALTESKHKLSLAYAFRGYRSTTQTIRDIEPRICSEPDIRKPLDCVPRSRQNENEARQAVYEGRSSIDIYIVIILRLKTNLRCIVPRALVFRQACCPKSFLSSSATCPPP